MPRTDFKSKNLPPLSDRGISPDQIAREHLLFELQHWRKERKGKQDSVYNYKSNINFFKIREMVGR